MIGDDFYGRAFLLGVGWAFLGRCGLGWGWLWFGSRILLTLLLGSRLILAAFSSLAIGFVFVGFRWLRSLSFGLVFSRTMFTATILCFCKS